MPKSHRPVLIPAGLKHPRVREFLAVKHHPDSRGLQGAVALEGTWLIRRAMAAGVRLEAVFACPALLRGPLAIVVGSERRSLARVWLAAADSVAAIPMLGISDSLNAAVAGALLLRYEALARDGHEPR